MSPWLIRPDKNRIFNNRIVWFFLCLLILINKFFVLKLFGFRYTGNDDLIFWHGASDYMHGIFREPFFYGQNYNYMVESLLAVPLLAIGLPHSIALPATSAFMGLFPFLLFSAVLFRKGYVINSYIFLVVPLTLPVEYDILSSLTRGFISGLFFISFLVFSLINPQRKKSFIILGLSTSFAYIVNANSLIFSFPVCIYLLLENYKKPAFYFITLFCSTPALIIQYFSEQFYFYHPEYKVHGLWNLDYSFDRVIAAFSHLDKFFNYMTPVYWDGNWVVLVIITVAGCIAFKKNWKKGLSLLLGIVFIFLVIGINKVNDDMGNVFLTAARMFLAIPLLLGLSLLWAKDVYVAEQKSKLAILCIALSVFFVKVSCCDNIIDRITRQRSYGPVAIKSIVDLEKQCSEMQQLISKYNIDLVVFIPSGEILNVPGLGFYNYGCPLLKKDFAPTVMSIYERRTWRFLEEEKAIRKTVLLFNLNPGQAKNVSRLDYEIINNDPGMVLIKNNNKSLRELSELLNFQYKRHNY